MQGVINHTRRTSLTQLCTRAQRPSHRKMSAAVRRISNIAVTDDSQSLLRQLCK